MMKTKTKKNIIDMMGIIVIGLGIILLISTICLFWKVIFTN